MGVLQTVAIATTNRKNNHFLLFSTQLLPFLELALVKYLESRHSCENDFGQYFYSKKWIICIVVNNCDCNQRFQTVIFNLSVNTHVRSKSIAKIEQLWFVNTSLNYNFAQRKYLPDGCPQRVRCVSWQIKLKIVSSCDSSITAQKGDGCVFIRI